VVARLFSVCVAISCLLLGVPGAWASPVEVTTAYALASDANNPPSTLRGSVTVSLPDNWDRTRPRFQGAVWYQLDLGRAYRQWQDLREAAPPGALAARMAILVPRLAHTGEVWLDGVRLMPRGGTPVQRNRTLWYDIDVAQWPSGMATLSVRVEGIQGTRSGLASVYLGEARELEAWFRWRDTLQSAVPQLLTAAAMLAVLVVLPWWLKRRERVALLLLLFCVCWLPRGAVAFSAAAPVPSGGLLWVLVALGTLQSVVVAELVMAVSAVQARWVRFRGVLYGATVLTLLVSAAVAWQGQLNTARFASTQAPFMALLLVPLVAQIRRAFVQPQPSNVALAAALSAWWVAAAHDFAQVADLTAYESFFWAPTALLAVLVPFAWRAVSSLAHSRDEADQALRDAVDVAVVRQAGELRSAFDLEKEQAKAAVRAQVVADERTRLLHDLHDGMGSQLITALRMVRRANVPREDVARLIEDALDDMRLIIDSLDLESRDLLPLLGSLRFRLEPRLRAIGVALHWDAEPLPDLDYLTPESGLAVVRVVQEAINNALRHGQAANVTISAKQAGQAVQVSVSDDGCGFDAEQPILAGHSRGLAAMQARARKLHATLHVASIRAGPPGAARGTTVTLALPLRVPPDALQD
jgi:signal transduction histidine kinase